jgi:benzoate transport
VVTLCFLLSMLDGADLLIMSFIAPVLSVDWSVSPEHLGVLFSASLLGMAIGCLFVAPFADKYGRRMLIIAALTVTATAMLLSAFSASIAELMVARLFVGIGVGTIGVTMTTMAAEYAPRRHTSFAVGFVQAGWPFGSIITAFAAARILPLHGWQSMLTGIGLISVGLLILVFFLLPESLSFLLLRRPLDARNKINAIRRRLRLSALTDLPPVEVRPRGIQVGVLFSGGRMIPSVLLWLAVTLGYFDLYFVISWIPKLAAQAGLPLAQAIYAGATYNLGAFIGTAAIGWVAIRYALNRVIATYLSVAAVAMLIFGGIAMPVALTLMMALIIGVTVQGGFNGFWALAAKLYPAEMRSTGVGGHVPLAAIFAAYAAPLIAAAAMTLRISVK